MTPKTDSVAVLRECPFCGQQPELKTHREYQSYSASEAISSGMGVSAGGFTKESWSIDCACGISIPGNNDVFLVARWNRRAALSAYSYVGIGPMRGGPRDGTDDVRWYYESPAAAEYHGCHTIFPLYTAPGGVGDAVTERLLDLLDVTLSGEGGFIELADGRVFGARELFLHIRDGAALAARTGQGE